MKMSTKSVNSGKNTIKLIDNIPRDENVRDVKGKFKCQICLINFLSRSSLSIHIRTIHITSVNVP